MKGRDKEKNTANPPSDSGVESMTSSKESLAESCQSDDSGLGSPTSGEEESNKDIKTSPAATRSSARIRQARDYDLRESSLINRIQTERRRSEPRQPKPKAKAPPLSKYRRRSANARERSRMKSINDAFDDLRQVIPELPTATLAPGTKVPTKITTLRLAMNYIAALREMLGYDAIVMPSVLPPLATSNPNEDNKELMTLREDLAHLGTQSSPCPEQPNKALHDKTKTHQTPLKQGYHSPAKAPSTLPVAGQVLDVPVKTETNELNAIPKQRIHSFEDSNNHLHGIMGQGLKVHNMADHNFQSSLTSPTEHTSHCYMDCTTLTPELELSPTPFGQDVTLTAGTLVADLAASALDVDLTSFLHSPTSSLSSHPGSMDSEADHLVS